MLYSEYMLVTMHRQWHMLPVTHLLKSTPGLGRIVVPKCSDDESTCIYAIIEVRSLTLTYISVNLQPYFLAICYLLTRFSLWQLSFSFLSNGFTVMKGRRLDSYHFGMRYFPSYVFHSTIR